MSENPTKNITKILFPSFAAVILLFLPIFSFASAENFSANKSNNPSFVQNLGQISYSDGERCSDVLFYTQTGDVKVFLRHKGISYVFSRLVASDFEPAGFMSYSQSKSSIEDNDVFLANMNKCQLVQWRTDIDFAGAGEPEISKSGESSSILNFYKTNCNDGIIGVKSYSVIVYKNIYPDIDIKFYFVNGQFKYDLILHPGADSQKPGFLISGASKIVRTDGSLELSTPIGDIIDSKPLSFNNKGEKVSSYYTLSEGIIKIGLGDYDKNDVLTIDPEVYWSTYFGGSIGDHLTAIHIDKNSEFVITGSTLSDDFPVSAGALQTKRNGFFDAIIAKFTPDCEKLWATYYGGTETDYGSGITVDKDLKVYMVGWTWSKDFPLTTDCYQPYFAGGENDGFVVKLDSTGAREWATYLGGEQNDHLYDIAVDSAQNIAITGWTASTNFPRSLNAFQPNKALFEDAFLVEYTKDCNFIWGTFLGGDSVDAGQSVEVDKNGNLIIAGYSKSLNFPVSFDANQKFNAGFFDAIIAKFDTTGNRLYSSYYGGSQNDYGMSLSVNTKAEPVICGYTNSTDLKNTSGMPQAKNNGSYDGFVAQFSKSIIPKWATYIGGSGDDYAYSVFADIQDNVLVIGRTLSKNLPVSVNATQKTLKGDDDAFAARFSSDGKSVFWETYIGGSGNEWGYAIASDKNMSVYTGGDTESNDFPVTQNAMQFQYANFIDIFMQKLCPTLPSPLIKANGPTTICEGSYTVLEAQMGFEGYNWSNGDTGRVITVTQPGNYFVNVTDELGCSGGSQIISIKVNPAPVPVITGNREFCKGDSTILDAGPKFKSYLWSTGQNTRLIKVKTSGKFVVDVSDANGCHGYDSVTITVFPLPKANIRGITTVCANSADIPYFIQTEPGVIYTWSASGGTLTQGTDQSLAYVSWGAGPEGKIIVSSENQVTGCKGSDTLLINVSDKLKPKILATGKNNFVFCSGDSILLDAGDGFSRYKWSTGDSSQYLSVKNPGIYSVSVKDASGCEGADTVAVSEINIPRPVIKGDTVVCSYDSVKIYQADVDSVMVADWKIEGGEVIQNDSSGKVTIKWNHTGQNKLALTIRDTISGCSNSDNIFVLFAPAPFLEINPKDTSDICEGDSIELTATSGFIKYKWSTGQETEKITVYSQGNYFVTATDKYDCSASSKSTIIVHPLPEKPVLAQSGDTLTSSTAFSYKWFEDGAVSSGDTNASIEMKPFKTYKVIIFNQFGCSNESDLFTFKPDTSVPRLKIGFLDTIFAKTGNEVNVPVRLLEYDNFYKVLNKELSFKLIYNSTISSCESPFVQSIINPDHRNASLTKVLSDSGVLILNLKFYAALGDMECDSLIITDAVVKNSNALIGIKNGVFCLTDVCKADGSRLYLGNSNFKLYQNTPNPFTDETEISFELDEDGFTKLTVIDVLGREIAVLFDKNATHGSYKVKFNADNIQSGIYYYTLTTPTRIITSKMELIK